MEFTSAEFIIGAADVKQFPSGSMPEIAFIGRSNVGKSSLLNMLVRRKKLAFVSATPGKTTEINFFVVNGKFILADLPGFGFAKASREQRLVWEKQRNTYLFKREQLKLICILVDSRHDPNEDELSLIENLENHQRRYLIVLTKGDKISKKQMEERANQLRELVAQCQFCVDVLPTSAEKHEGRDELVGIVNRIVREA